MRMYLLCLGPFFVAVGGLGVESVDICFGVSFGNGFARW